MKTKKLQTIEYFWKLKSLEWTTSPVYLDFTHYAQFWCSNETNISSCAEMHDMQTKTVFLHILPLLYILQQLKFPIQNLQWAAEEEAGIRLRESLNLIFCDSIMSGINSEQESYEGSKKEEERSPLA